VILTLTTTELLKSRQLTTKFHSTFKTSQNIPLLEAAKKGLIHQNHKVVQFLGSPQKSSPLHRYVLETKKSEDRGHKIKIIKNKFKKCFNGKKTTEKEDSSYLMYSLPPSGVTEGNNVKLFSKLINVNDKTVLSLEQ
jgi:hypothetical protein